MNYFVIKIFKKYKKKIALYTRISNNKLWLRIHDSFR